MSVTALISGSLINGTFSALIAPVTNTPIATAGSGTLTAAALVGALITRTGPSGNFSDATDSAVNIAAALPVNTIGQSWQVLIVNASAYQMTITGGTGVTLSGPAVTAVAANCVGVFVMTYTATSAVTMQLVGVFDRGIDNLNATTDPGVGSDNTLGYGPGSSWMNTTLQREWTCMTAGTGTAVWYLSGLVPGTGVVPSSLQTQFGAAAMANPQTAFAQFTASGILYKNVANPIAANAADTTDDILDGFVLPASSFDVAKRGLQLTFSGKFGATGNNKKVRVWLNPNMSGQTVTAGVISGGTVTGAGSGVLLYDSTAQTGNAVGWSILAQLFKYGSGGSNTQYAQVEPIFGTAHGGVTLPSFLTLTESSAINIVVTGSSSTTGAANDVVLNFSQAQALN
jgi:hypothetical protein